MDTTVSELVLTHSELGYVLDRHGLDYCAKGELTLLAACSEQGLDPARVLIACDAAIRQRQATTIAPAAHSATHLLLTVVAHHHRYLHQTMPLLQQLMDSVVRVAGQRLPALQSVAGTVEALVQTMKRHLDEEERDVFPALIRGNASEVRDKLRTVHGDHDRLMRLLEDLRRYCADYVAPRWAENRHRVLYAELAYFDLDTRRHLSFENEVLMPRFVADATTRQGAMVRSARP